MRVKMLKARAVSFGPCREMCVPAGSLVDLDEGQAIRFAFEGACIPHDDTDEPPASREHTQPTKPATPALVLQRIRTGGR